MPRLRQQFTVTLDVEYEAALSPLLLVADGLERQVAALRANPPELQAVVEGSYAAGFFQFFGASGTVAVAAAAAIELAAEGADDAEPPQGGAVNEGANAPPAPPPAPGPGEDPAPAVEQQPQG